MSGIAAAFGPEGGPAPEAALRAVAATLAHRGSVAALSTSGPAALVQLTSREPLRRSADLAADPRLATLHVVADARIDNRAELRAAGLDIDESTTGAEVIARAYARWSTDAARHLLGDFAFALWDAARQELYCARDHLGVRPLFYRHDHGAFFCASEAHALRAALAEPVRPNAFEIALFIAEEHRVAGPSLYVGIQALPPAHWLLVSAASTRLERYWTPVATHVRRDADERELARELGLVFAEAVRCRLDPEGPTGVELSGGLDSSSVAVQAAALATVRPTALHLRHPGLACDEEPQARAVADHAGLGWLALDATQPDTTRPRMTPGHPDLLYYPTMSCFEPLYAVARKERGIRTALTGVGSDQLFDETDFECADALHALDLGLVAEMTGMREHPLSLGSYRALLARGVQPLLPAPLRRLVRAMRDAPMDSFLAHRMAHAVVTATRERERAMAARAFPSLAGRQLCEELERFTTAVPLWQSDQLGAWSGIAIAHPFLDRRVVDLAVAMPPRSRWGHGWRKAKPVLRGAMRPHLPHGIADRRDAAEFSPYIREALFGEHRAVVLDLFGGDCRLADLGVVDLDAIRRAFDSTSPFMPKRLGFAVSMELWLRHLWA